MEREFRRYLDCGILAHGFARARCGNCGHDFLIAFSCKGRAVCPSCNARRMVETAAHLTDHVFPRLPVRQWVLVVPKRLRYFLHRDADLQGAALRLFLRLVEQRLRAHSPGAGTSARLGAVAFIHRFGSTLNPHLHFHCVVIEGVFEPDPAGSVIFQPRPGSMRTPSPKCKRAYAGACFAASCGAACCQAMTHGRWGNGNTAVAFPSTRRCASRPLTAR
ncbi:MAG: transposase zinc-binding domain-containing protein, partial [Burkholderiales bacterium]|nr:transposase zinc-binding domain-containing protein [Burkholderiales bacterium]